MELETKDEQSGLAKLINDRIESLRPKLQDTTRRNPLINNVLSSKSAAFVRIVDEKPQSIVDHLFSDNSRSMHLVSLPPTDIDPPDEDTNEFKTAFQNAQATDEVYNTAIAKIDFEFDERAIDKQEKAERELKDRVREVLDMPPRAKSEQFSDLINHAKSHGINPSSSLPLPEHEVEDNRFDDDNLQTLLLPKTFQSRMARILSKAKMFEEERGIEAVYLVLGYLRWTLPNATVDDEFKSPLILLPVKLNKRKTPLGEDYFIESSGDIIFNPSLAHKLTSEARVDVSEIAEKVQKEKIEIEHIFQLVDELQPKNMRWKVVREASFGVYPFQGIDLYYDLDTANLDFSAFSVISDLMLGKQNESAKNIEFAESDIESEKGKQLVPHLVLDADSSQFIALLKVANKENIALEGPPGSGKSQTIVNAISNAIYNGQKVLFVAQKVTALEVVFSRLQSLGLEHFVLPMMGGYGNTEEFYDALDSRLKLKKKQSLHDITEMEHKLKLQRARLAKYIEILTSNVSGTSMNVHQVMGVYLSNHEHIERLDWDLKAVFIDFGKYSQNFRVKDISDISESIASWCERLSQTEMQPNSAWVDTDPVRMNPAIVSRAIHTSRDVILRLEEQLSRLDDQNRQRIQRLLDNTFSEVKNGVEVSKAGNKIAELEVIQKIGVEKARDNLLAIKQKYSLLEEIAEISGRTKIELQELALMQSEFSLFLKFLVDFSMPKFSLGTVKKIDEQFREEVLLLSRFSKFRQELLKIDIDLPIEKISFLANINANSVLIKKLNSQLRLLGTQETLSQFRRARKLLAQLQDIIGEQQLPNIRAINKQKEVFEKTGFFSFLSKEFKEVKEQTLELCIILDKKDPKQKFILALEELIEVSSEWQKLELSNEIESPSKSDRAFIDKMIFLIDELQTASERLGLSSNQVSQVIEIDGISEIISTIQDSPYTLTSWEQIETQLSELEEKITFFEQHSKKYTELESLCIDNKISSVKNLEYIVQQCEVIKSLSKDIQIIENELQYSFENSKNVDEWLSAINEYSNIPTIIRELLIDIKDDEFISIVDSILPTLEVLIDTSSSLQDAKKIAGERFEAQTLSECLRSLNKHIDDQQGLNSLITRRAIIKEAESLGLEELLASIEKVQDPDSWLDLSKAVISLQLHKIVELKYGADLMEFTGTSLTDARKQLQNLDRQIIEASPLEVAASALDNARPPQGNSFGRKSEYTESALLIHELSKKRRTPPRKVLKRAREALMELFPCWMMVPTAVAQHLPRDSVFDLVIIDEASQMTPENSISALMRGQNTLIAGDTNQLPPTNFFKGLSSDEDEDEDVATTEESILELANMQFHPKHRLLWHYRSRHEDLIAFSNHYVYDSELVIFPSPGSVKNELGISLVQVKGTFQRGINTTEAQVMLDAIINFMTESPHRSLGVAVMNQSQMEHIESLVLRESLSNNVVAKYLESWESKREGLEKFFVKNLENIQGDERDVIFIGTVYGRDGQGKFYQRFGPINGASGKRRLNVLFTRAKEQIITFTSIPMSDFIPSDNNEGATLLKRWLEFSQTKRLGEITSDNDRQGYPDSPFEEHVIEVIDSLGYEAIPQVGVSSYFIDIGVKHKSYPYGYICGVECDGATYHSSQSSRVRDRLREEVLKRLGWNLYRIWSTDWFRDPYGGREQLKKYLDDRLSELTEALDKHESISVVIEHSHISDHEIDVKVEDSIHNVQNEPNKPKLVNLGDKIVIRYLGGPRAGTTMKLWLQQVTDDQAFQAQGYKTVGLDSPLGEAILDAEEGEVVHFDLREESIPVEIDHIED